MHPAVYVVFGATGGIGGALAELLAAQPGAKLLLSGRSSERLAGVAARAAAAGPAAEVASLAADPLDCAAVESVVGEAVKRYGRVDGVANCVGSVLLKSGAPSFLLQVPALLLPAPAAACSLLPVVWLTAALPFIAALPPSFTWHAPPTTTASPLLPRSTHHHASRV